MGSGLGCIDGDFLWDGNGFSSTAVTESSRLQLYLAPMFLMLETILENGGRFAGNWCQHVAIKTPSALLHVREFGNPGLLFSSIIKMH